MELISMITNTLGVQHIFKASNGFGASVINYGYGSEKGLYEVGVLRFVGDSYGITYDTDITQDVVGSLNEVEVENLLRRIEALTEANLLPYVEVE